ncbi:MAG: redoxin domain-containing protein [Patescibacteria group bacterium]|nr:redoxin domain-containing protein [Patescibacteria group bacterium]
MKDILGENKTILYFYPRDNTPGCTLENKDFTSLKSRFEEK